MDSLSHELSLEAWSK